MFLSETIARAIHADRIRELERAAHDHRLLAAADDQAAAREVATSVRIPNTAKQPACGDSAGLPA